MRVSKQIQDVDEEKWRNIDFETNSRKIKLKAEIFARFRGKNEEIWIGFMRFRVKNEEKNAKTKKKFTINDMENADVFKILTYLIWSG